MDLEQTVRAAFELREPQPDFEDVVMARLAASTWRASQPTPRRRRHIVLIGTLLVVTAAAAMLVAQFKSAPPGAALPVSNLGAVVSPAGSAMASPGSRAPEQALVADESPVQPVTVFLSLDQVTGDAIGRDYGQRVYERAREELRALAGVVLVDASTAAAVAPAFRITYANFAESYGSSPARLAVELVFQVEALQPRANGAAAYQPVFRSNPPPPGVVYMPPPGRGEMIPSLEQEPELIASTARMSLRPAMAPNVPADCIERRAAGCPYTPADIAAFSILSWRLQKTPPDILLVARLHAMLRDPSSPIGLRLMALVNLHKYRKLRLEASELLAAADWVGADDPTLYRGLLNEALSMGNRPELMRQVQASLLGAGLFEDALTTGNRADLPRSVQDVLQRELPNGRRVASTGFRQELIVLLATELKNEPTTQGVLESIAANDPDFHVRAEAKRALGQPQPAASFMGPIDEP